MEAIGIALNEDNETPQGEFRKLYERALKGEELSTSDAEKLYLLFGQAQTEKWDISDLERWTDRRDYFPGWDFKLERFPDVFPLDEESDYIQMKKRLDNPDGDKLLPNENERWAFYNNLLLDKPTKIPEWVPLEVDSVMGDNEKRKAEEAMRSYAERFPPPSILRRMQQLHNMPEGPTAIYPDMQDYLGQFLTWEEGV